MTLVTKAMLTEANELSRALHAKLLAAMSDEAIELYYTSQALDVARNMANGSLNWGPAATWESVTEWLTDGIAMARAALGPEVPSAIVLEAADVVDQAFTRQEQREWVMHALDKLSLGRQLKVMRQWWLLLTPEQRQDMRDLGGPNDTLRDALGELYER